MDNTNGFQQYMYTYNTSDRSANQEAANHAERSPSSLTPSSAFPQSRNVCCFMIFLGAAENCSEAKTKFPPLLCVGGLGSPTGSASD